MLEIGAAEARRMALAAQGFADPRPAGRVDARHVRKVLRRIHLLQIDSVNVLVRAHYVPLFSRLGAYPRSLLGSLAYERRELFEYWAHEASLLPVEFHRLFRWRMAQEDGWWFREWTKENRALIEAVAEEVAARGPLAARELEDPGRSDGPWWGWADGKRALERLFFWGRVTTANRRNFERLYDVPERVLPRAVLDAPTPTRSEAIGELGLRAARALGVATAPDIADYFRLQTAEVRPALDAFVDTGELVRARVEGWSQPAYLDAAARTPRAIRAAALVSPFDPLVFNRKRVKRLFDFDYAIEIYVPAPKRRYGYYVLPFLMGERLVGRTDLKADRKASVLRVLGAWAEPATDRDEVATALGAELRTMASWLGLEHVSVARKGDLAAPLRRSVG